MGISGLLPLLKEIQVSGHISEFKGKRLAVDAYVWLHKGAFGCAAELVKGIPTTKFVDYAMYRVRMLKYHGITPYIVFDGGPLPAKKGTEVSRAASRKANLEKALALESQGRHSEAREAYTKCVDITPEIAYQFIKALRAENIEYVVAPYEADAQLFFLEREGIVDGIITEDSDLLVFGCKKVIYKLDKDGKCVWINREKFAFIREFPMHGWSDTQFRRMAMLSGCDYLDSIPGMGLKTAYKLLRKHKTVEKLFQQIRLEGQMQIPPNYQKDFAQAELAFLHQRVFDPIEGRLVPLYDFPEGGLEGEDEKWVGLDKPVHIALGISRGDLHPETGEAIVDSWKDHNPAKSFTKNAKPVLGESTRANVSAGPMDAFISRGKRATALLPRPVGKFGSGAMTLSTVPAGPSKKRPLPKDEDDEPILGKTSRFFGARITDPKGGECNDVAGPARRTRSPTAELENIRSPSPFVSAWNNSSQPSQAIEVETLSPIKPRLRAAEAEESMPLLSSPAGTAVSSPAFTTPPKSLRGDTFSPSPTKCSVAVAQDLVNGQNSSRIGPERNVLINPSSSAPDLSQGPEYTAGSVRPTSSLDTITPMRKHHRTLSTLGKILIPASSPHISSPIRGLSLPLPRHNSLNRNETAASSDSFAEEEKVTPSFGQNGGGRDEIEDGFDSEDEIEAETRELERAEAERVRRAKFVGAGLKERFGYKGVIQMSSSPSAPSPAKSKRFRSMTAQTHSITPQRQDYKEENTSTSVKRGFAGTGILSSREINVQRTPLTISRGFNKPRKVSDENSFSPDPERSALKAKVGLVNDKVPNGTRTPEIGGNENGLSWKRLEQYRFSGTKTSAISLV